MHISAHNPENLEILAQYLSYTSRVNFKESFAHSAYISKASGAFSQGIRGVTISVRAEALSSRTISAAV